MAVEVEIYSDGACLGNPGPGGWGAILMAKDKKKKFLDQNLIQRIIGWSLQR